MLFAPMTREASDVDLAVRKFGVDFVSHDNHRASDILVRIFIAGKIALNVAPCAFHPERCVVSAHCLANVGVGWKNLQVLRRTGRPTFLLAFAGLLGAERKKDC